MPAPITTVLLVAAAIIAGSVGISIAVVILLVLALAFEGVTAWVAS